MYDDVSSNGGWVLDNFPRTREQWNVLIEKGGQLPDDVICLRDDSDNGDYLVKRWYRSNREDIDAKANARKAAAQAEKERQEEEQRWGLHGGRKDGWLWMESPYRWVNARKT